MFSYLAWTPGPWEIIAFMIVALLLFGRRLPEVGRSLGKGIVEFKKGLSGVEDDLNQAGRASAAPGSKPPAAMMTEHEPPKHE